MKKLMIFGGASAIVLAATAVIAAPGHGRMKMDTDGNGVVTKAEAKSVADARFSKLDVDGNGQLDAADKSARMKAHFSEMDADGNGAISEAEFIAGHEAKKAKRVGKFKDRKGRRHARLQKADTNGDKVISRDEFSAFAEARFARKDKDSNGELSGDELKRGKGMRRGHHGGRGHPMSAAGPDAS